MSTTSAEVQRSEAGRETAKTVRRVFELCRRYYPLTATGTVVFGIGVLFVALGSVRGDVYRATLGVTALTVTLALALFSRLQAGRFGEVEAKWDDPPSPAARTFGASRLPALKVAIPGIRPWFFFRVHARVTGTLHAGNGRRFHVFEDIASPEVDRIDLPLAIPLPGRLNLRRTIEIRDVFGLSRGSFGSVNRRPLSVEAPYPIGPEITRMVAASGEQESTRTTNPEEERYYQREYLPGDRIRDINWKASARIRELVTRISPQTQDQDRTLTVYLRHFAESGLVSLESLGHLAYVKGWLAAFMLAVMREESGVHFRVITSRGISKVDDENAVAELSHSLCDLPFEPEPQTLARDPSARTVLVFTTPFDQRLGAFVESMAPVASRVFTTQFSNCSGNAGTHSYDMLDLTLGSSALPFPGARLRHRGERRAVSVPAGAVLLEEVELEPLRSRSDLAEYAAGGSERR